MSRLAFVVASTSTNMLVLCVTSTIWGGSSADYSEFVRGKVVNVALDDDFVAGFDNLSVVNLYNMNLANVTDLPDKIPEKAWRMSLRNDLLTSFPYTSPSFAYLQILYVANANSSIKRTGANSVGSAGIYRTTTWPSSTASSRPCMRCKCPTLELHSLMSSPHFDILLLASAT